MTDLAFSINGVDFRSAVNKNGYKTFLPPVYGAEMTTLSGVRVRPVQRYRGELHVVLNDLEAAQAAQLGLALLADPLQVTYFSFQRGKTVTETMQLENYALAQLLKDGGERWLTGVTLKFEQN